MVAALPDPRGLSCDRVGPHWGEDGLRMMLGRDNPVMAARLSTFAFAANRVWDVAAGIAIVAVVLVAFDPVRQGYHFTFASLSLAAGVLEGGIGFLLLQFMAHEWARVQWRDGTLTGDATAVANLVGLARRCVLWHVGLVVPIMLVLQLAGWIVFAGSGDEVGWSGPWLLLSVAVALQVMARGFQYVLEAENRLILVQGVTMASNIVGAVVVVVHVLRGPDLYILGLYTLGRAGVQAAVSLWAVAPLLRAGTGGHPPTLDWRRDVLPQQIRTMAATALGFAMYQSVTPIVFRIAGPELAGQIGFGMQVHRTLNALNAMWLYSAQPRGVRLLALGERAALGALYRATLRRSLAAAAFLGLATLAALAVLAWRLPDIGSRMLDTGPLAVLMVALVGQQFSNVQTAFVRMERRERFLDITFVGAVLVMIAVALGAAMGSPIGIVCGFAAAVLVVVGPWTMMRFRAHRGW